MPGDDGFVGALIFFGDDLDVAEMITQPRARDLGGLFEQEAQVARSGGGDDFSHIEIVSEKNQRAYEAIVARHQVSPERFLMVGNSIKSDILPVLAMGGRAVYIPYETTWFHETVPDSELEQKEFVELRHIRLL